MTAKEEDLRLQVTDLVLRALDLEAPGHGEAVLSGFRSSVRPLKKVKGQTTADFTTSAAIAAFHRAASGLGPPIAKHADPFELSCAVLQRLRELDGQPNGQPDDDDVDDDGLGTAGADGAGRPAREEVKNNKQDGDNNDGRSSNHNNNNNSNNSNNNNSNNNNDGSNNKSPSNDAKHTKDGIIHHAWVESLGALFFITKHHFQAQHRAGKVLCLGCGVFFADGGARRQHALNAKDTRCIDFEAGEYYQKASQEVPGPSPIVQASGTSATEAAKKTKTLDIGIAAARDGDLATLQGLVSAHQWNPKAVVDHHGNNALHWAAGAGHLEVVQWLVLTCGMDPSRPNSRHHGRTPLHWAARNGRAEVCRWLLTGCDYNMQVDVNSDNGETPFMLAAWQGHTEVCQLLLKLGANVEHLNQSRCTAMHKAARMDGAASSLEMIQLLLHLRLDPLAANSNGHTALHKAAQHGSKPAVEYLLQEAGCRCREATLQDRDRNSPSSLALAAGYPNLASQLRHEEDLLWLAPAIYHGAAGSNFEVTSPKSLESPQSRVQEQQAHPSCGQNAQGGRQEEPT